MQPTVFTFDTGGITRGRVPDPFGQAESSSRDRSISAQRKAHETIQEALKTALTRCTALETENSALQVRVALLEKQLQEQSRVHACVAQELEISQKRSTSLADKNLELKEQLRSALNRIAEIIGCVTSFEGERYRSATSSPISPAVRQHFIDTWEERRVLPPHLRGPYECNSIST